MKRFISVCICFSLLMGFIDIINVHAENNIIKNDQTGIPDAMLYRLLLNECDDNKDKFLSTEEILSVNSLSSENFGITNLKGINLLTNLKKVRFVDENIESTVPFNGMIKLETINLTGSNVKDFSGLRHLTNLTELRLGDNKITDISALQGLTDLRILELYQNNISDISALKNLTNLTDLHLYENEIVDVTPLSNMVNLTELLAYDNNISDISSLNKLTALKILSFSTNKISDISVLSNMIKLQELMLNNNKIVNINSLSKLNELKELYLNNNNISDISAIADLIYLQRLELSNNKLTVLPNLKMLTDLAPIVYWPPLALGTNLTGNKLTEKELRNKMPKHVVEYSDWVDRNKYIIPDVKNAELVTAKGNSVKIKWDKCDQAKYYKIFRTTDYYGEDLKEVGKVDAKLTTFIENNLSPNKEYYYYIVAYDEVNDEVLESEKYSNRVTVHTAPKPVTDVKAVGAGKNKVKVTWSKADGADGYIIYRKIGNGKFEYRYMVTKTSFTDVTASDTEYNYYRVYPYVSLWNSDKKILSDNGNYDYAKGGLSSVTGLRALSAGKKKVNVTWNKVTGADGYIIYRKVGNGKFEYRYMVKGTSFTDTTASSKEYNFYRVYPYYNQNGKRILGPSINYDYAKGVLKAATKLTAYSAGKNKVKVSWNAVPEAEGYIIYRKVGNGKFVYRYMVKETSFTDTTASSSSYNYYRIYPYHTENGKRVLGISDEYKYAKGSNW